MKVLYFLVYKTGDQLFGAITEEHGHLPAFFTDENNAAEFFGQKVLEEEKEDYVFAQTEKLDDVRKYINFHEKSYVMLDEIPMTGVEMFKVLNEEKSTDTPNESE